MSWAADGQDGNGLHLEKNVANSFQVYCFRLGKLTKTRIMVYFLFKISLHIFLSVFYKYFVHVS